jgi:DNA modification methylase
VGLPLFFIEAFSDKGDAWIDPFLGSGTTVVACEYAGRSGLGIETSPQYVAVSLERLDNLGLEIDRVAVVTADEN